MEEKKSMMVARPFTTMRELVNYVNDNNIKREDVVNVLPTPPPYWLVYYINK